ncbi:PAS domain S-box-containing protein [Cognatiyoonia koreensis]|uniref:histidine kinase n=1 Tax=Cognatiyoonia koreensis TaxID=364200 RepID=A0A1I0NRL2_9RHOB|nr:HWE histidine kinase domain-containing protein [Cognatiyoonia koreensis]SEW04111.1 PAS domain S-box-containing protein [Cognatiyoonia koreensis]
MPLDYKAVFVQSPAPCMILNRQLGFVAANPAYLAMVGKSEEDLIGNQVFEVFPENSDRIEHMLTVFEETFAGKPITFTEMPFRINVDGKMKQYWWTARHAVLTGKNSDEKYLIQYSENVSEAVKARQMRNAQMGELQHRVGNIFSIVSAIARQTGRASDNIAQFLSTFEARIGALVRVNRQLTGVSAPDETIASVIEQQMVVHSDEARNRMKIDGPDYPLSMLQSQAISMAIHELATNSLKYGVISQNKGEISLHWENLPNGGCRLEWQEVGIVVKQQAENSGYGTLLLTSIIPSQLGGTAAFEFGDEFFRYRLEID